MRSRFRLSVVPFGIALVQACAPATTPNAAVVPPPMPPSVPTTSGGTVPVPAELRAAHDAYVAAWNGEDPAAVGAFFTDDTHGVIGDSMFHGRARLVSAWVTPNLPTLSDLVPTPETFNVSGNQITETGRYRFRASMQGGTQMVGGRYMHVWTRQPDGSWRITATTVGSAAPIP
ncbi:MAG TPA: nuclear transport factor 2 family protein [Longimicrobium sp.]|nr:nuclear transport factor 2 family protein [Longimicrobium sp.]